MLYSEAAPTPQVEAGRGKLETQLMRLKNRQPAPETRARQAILRALEPGKLTGEIR
jgi:hypothetical protein